jgi:hypothetical protein
VCTTGWCWKMRTPAGSNRLKVAREARSTVGCRCVWAPGCGHRCPDLGGVGQAAHEAWVGHEIRAGKVDPAEAGPNRVQGGPRMAKRSTTSRLAMTARGTWPTRGRPKQTLGFEAQAPFRTASSTCAATRLRWWQPPGHGPRRRRRASRRPPSLSGTTRRRC